MPYLHLHTSVKLSDAQIVDIRKAVYELIPILPNKTYDVTMIHISDNQIITLKDVDVPAAFVDLRLMGPSPYAEKQEFVRAFIARLTELTGIDAHHIYLNIAEHEEWGAHGTLNHI